MQTFADGGRLGAVLASGRTWFAIETESQLQSALRDTVHGGRTSFPWQVSIARADSFSTLSQAPRQSRRLVLALSEAAEYRSVSPAADASDPAERRATTQSYSILAAGPDAHAHASPSPAADAPHAERPFLEPPRGLAEPLLRPGEGGGEGGGDEARRAGSRPIAASVAPLGGDACAVSIETDHADVGRTAYLIDVPPSGYPSPVKKIASASFDGFDTPMLAVPTTPVEEAWGAPLLGIPTLTLPSAVRAVRMEMLHLDETAVGERGAADGKPALPTVQLTVETRVPVAGWLLLCVALVSSQSGGAVTDLQQRASASDEAHVFLRASWRGVASSSLVALVAVTVSDGRRGLVGLYRSDRGVRLRLLASGAFFFLNKAGFNVALGRTSLTHAAVFESASSLWIVVGQLALLAAGSVARVPPPHVAGVLVGAGGMVLCTLDAAAGGASSTAGDATAMLSGVGSCVYLTLAESLRLSLDPNVFYAAVMVQFAVYSAAAAFFLDDSPPDLIAPLDPARGFFGWLHPRLIGPQLWLAVVVDLCGNLGFIAVLKYVPALVVASSMLLGPFVATAEGMLLGVEEMPGAWTLAGSLVIVCGCGIIVTSEQTHSTTVEI